MLISKFNILLNPGKLIFQTHNYYHCWIAGITKAGRKIIQRRYPVHVINPDGSSIHATYHKPVGIVRLPINLALLSEEERQALLEKRKIKTKIVIQDELEDDFDESQYLRA